MFSQVHVKSVEITQLGSLPARQNTTSADFYCSCSLYAAETGDLQCTRRRRRRKALDVVALIPIFSIQRLKQMSRISG